MSSRRNSLFDISRMMNVGLKVVSAAVIRNTRNVRLSAVVTPAHGDKVDLLLLIHRIRSMHLGIEAQWGEVALRGKDLRCFHFE
jgi:hypothetical protein